MNWISTDKELPQENRKYPVVISDQDGNKKLGWCSFSVRKQRFHFDMHHIQWRVVAWYNLPEYFDNSN